MNFSKFHRCKVIYKFLKKQKKQGKNVDNCIFFIIIGIYKCCFAMFFARIS